VIERHGDAQPVCSVNFRPLGDEEAVVQDVVMALSVAPFGCPVVPEVN
jgi:hypothetical protein